MPPSDFSSLRVAAPPAVPSAGRFLAALLAVSVAATAAWGQAPSDDATAQEPAGWAGLIVRPISPELAAQLAEVLPSGTGVVVTHVVADSPAAAAGLRTFDVVARCDDLDVEGEPFIRERIAAAPPGTRVDLRVVRAAKLVDVAIETAARPRTLSAAGKGEGRSKESTGPAEGATAAGRKALRTRGLTMATDGGPTYELSVVAIDSAGRFEQNSISGELSELAERVDELPDGVRNSARNSIARAAGAASHGPGVRCQLQPKVDGGDVAVRVVISRSGRDGERRVFEMEHAVDAGREVRGEELLEVELLAEELERLPPSIRNELEGALRRLRIPKVRVEVQNSL